MREGLIKSALTGYVEERAKALAGVLSPEESDLLFLPMLEWVEGARVPFKAEFSIELPPIVRYPTTAEGSPVSAETKATMEPGPDAVVTPVYSNEEIQAVIDRAQANQKPLDPMTPFERMVIHGASPGAIEKVRGESTASETPANAIHDADEQPEEVLEEIIRPHGKPSDDPIVMSQPETNAKVSLTTVKAEVVAQIINLRGRRHSIAWIFEHYGFDGMVVAAIDKQFGSLVAKRRSGPFDVTAALRPFVQNGMIVIRIAGVEDAA